jgi:hypothetical protein
MVSSTLSTGHLYPHEIFLEIFLVSITFIPGVEAHPFLFQWRWGRTHGTSCWKLTSLSLVPRYYHAELLLDSLTYLHCTHRNSFMVFQLLKKLNWMWLEFAAHWERTTFSFLVVIELFFYYVRWKHGVELQIVNIRYEQQETAPSPMERSWRRRCRHAL